MKRKKLAVIVIAVFVLLTIALTLAKGDLTNITSTEQLGNELGIITIIPAIFTVLLAFITNNVLFSLLMGFLLGVLLLTLTCVNTLAAYPLAFIRIASSSIKEVIFDFSNIEILLVCVFLGGMMNVVKASGGLKAFAVKLTRKINTPKKAGLFASLIGCLIFFDDYANSLIVGPIMKPIIHRVKMSKEKLAFIINSTSASVAGVAVISSWIAIETSSIKRGFEILNLKTNYFSVLLKSLPYCFFCFFIIIFVFLNSLIGKEYGPMLEAEKQARSIEEHKVVAEENEDDETLKKKILTGLGSVIILTILSVAMFYITGRFNAIQTGVFNMNDSLIDRIITAISHADTVIVINVCSFACTIYAIIFGCRFRLFTLKQAIKSWIEGVYNLFGTMLLLILAWSLAQVVKNSGAIYYAIESISVNVAWQLIPALIFISCCVISFASGSFGTMYVVMPLAIPLAYKMFDLGVTNKEVYLLSCIGAVISGAIFGDNCSPIADCTLLSAAAAGCDTIDHVNTQTPYLLTVCVLTFVAILMTSIGISNIFIWLIIIGAQAIILLTIGKKPI